MRAVPMHDAGRFLCHGGDPLPDRLAGGGAEPPSPASPLPISWASPGRWARPWSWRSPPGMQPNLTWNPLEPAATISAYIVQVALGDLPHGSIGYQTIFAAGLDADADDLGLQYPRTYWLKRVPGGLLMRYSPSPDPDAFIARHKMGSSSFAVSRHVCSLAGILHPGGAVRGELVLPEGCERNRLAVLHVLSRLGMRHKRASFPAWVGPSLIMLVTALCGRAAGSGGGDLPGRVRPEELDDRIDRDQGHQSGRRAVHRLWLAGPGAVCLQIRLGRRAFLSAGLTLALLILPVVIVATREAFGRCRWSIREAAYALGATKWQTVAHHVLPYSAGRHSDRHYHRLARAIGETAPIITIGALTFIAFLPPSPITRHLRISRLNGCSIPFTVMPIQMFNWMSRPGGGLPSQRCGRRRVICWYDPRHERAGDLLRYRMRTGELVNRIRRTTILSEQAQSLKAEARDLEFLLWRCWR